jgi:hypothetical protein
MDQLMTSSDVNLPATEAGGDGQQTTLRRRHQSVSSTRPMLLRHWLIEQANSQNIPGLTWIDPGLLRIPWRHKSRSEFNGAADGLLFKAWAEYKGRDVTEPKHKEWKRNFRCALSSLKDVKIVNEMCKKTGTDAYVVYRFLPETTRKKDADINVNTAAATNGRRQDSNSLNSSHSSSSSCTSDESEGSDHTNNGIWQLSDTKHDPDKPPDCETQTSATAITTSYTPSSAWCVTLNPYVSPIHLQSPVHHCLSETPRKTPDRVLEPARHSRVIPTPAVAAAAAVTPPAGNFQFDMICDSSEWARSGSDVINNDSPTFYYTCSSYSSWNSI